MNYEACFWSGFRWGTVFGVGLVWIMIVLSGCQETMTEDKRRLMSQQLIVMQALTAGTIPEPTIVYVKRDDFEIGAQANCNNWTISMNWYAVVNHTEFMAFNIIPHEYAHLLSCHYRGGVGKDPHDEWWRKTVIRLGGDPEFI